MARADGTLSLSSALEIGAAIGVLDGGHAHGRKLLSEVSKLRGGEFSILRLTFAPLAQE
jgi:hypothetical protein